MSVSFECWVLSGRGLCDELITRPEESYRLWCVVVCDLEISWMRRIWPTGGLSPPPPKKKSRLVLGFIQTVLLLVPRFFSGSKLAGAWRPLTPSSAKAENEWSYTSAFMLSTERFYIFIFRVNFRIKGLRNWEDVERSGDCGLVLLSQHLPEEWRKNKKERKQQAG